MKLKIALYTGISLSSLAGGLLYVAGLDVVAGYILALLSIVLLTRFLAKLVASREFTVDLLMAVVGMVTLYYGLLVEGLIILLLYGIAETMEEFIEARAEKEIEAIASHVRNKVLKESGGRALEVDVRGVEPGDVIIVRVGEAVPLDGEALGEGVIDASLVTGEPLPVEVKPGDKVLSGSLVVEGPLRLRVLRKFEESHLARLVRLAREAVETKPRVTRVIERLTPLLTLLVLGLFAPVLYLYGPVKALPIILVGCPSAFIISSAFLASYSIARLARHGILVRNAGVLEAMSGVTAVVLDKTGTLTELRVDPERVEPPPGYGKMEFLGIVGSYAKYSRHPVSRALHGYSMDESLTVREVRGVGLVGSSGGLQVEIRGGRLGECGKLLEAVVNGASGYICLREEPRPGAGEFVSFLKSLGVRVVMASGDDPGNVARVARMLGIKEYYGGMKPEDKARLVEELQGEGHRVTFVGDGVNDSVALARADVGVAVGELDVARKVADVSVRGTPSQLLELFMYGTRLKPSIMAAFYSAGFLKLLVGFLGVAGLIGLPFVAFLGDDGSTFTGLGVGLYRLGWGSRGR